VKDGVRNRQRANLSIRYTDRLAEAGITGSVGNREEDDD
jgi:hypothetical protein